MSTSWTRSMIKTDCQSILIDQTLTNLLMVCSKRKLVFHSCLTIWLINMKFKDLPLILSDYLKLRAVPHKWGFQPLVGLDLKYLIEDPLNSKILMTLRSWRHYWDHKPTKKIHRVNMIMFRTLNSRLMGTSNNRNSNHINQNINDRFLRVDTTNI